MHAVHSNKSCIARVARHRDRQKDRHRDRYDSKSIFNPRGMQVAMFKELPALRSSLVNISNYDDRFKKPMGGGYRDINVLLRVVHAAT